MPFPKKNPPGPSVRDGQVKRPEKTITDRHRIIATLMASGWSNEAIRKQVRCGERFLSTARKDPKFQQYLAQVRDEVRNRLIDSRFNIFDAIDNDSKENFEFVRSTRRDTQLDPKHRLRASLALLARQAPVATEREDAGGLHIHLGGRDLRGMARALKEAKLIEGPEAAAIEAEFDAEET